MTTGTFWDVTDPLKPWGYFDPDAQLDIPFDWATWLTDISGTYVSHTIDAGTVLDEVSSAHSAGVIVALIKVAIGQTAVVGTKYPVTCHIVATAGGLTVEDERTVWLKIKER